MSYCYAGHRSLAELPTYVCDIMRPTFRELVISLSIDDLLF
jgi:hypothetical protein